MSDIFREVDEEIRQDQAKMLWDKYGKFAIAAAVLIVVLVGGIKAWQYYTLKQQEQAGTDYFSSLTLANDGKDAEAITAFKTLAKSGSTGFALLAKFQEAGLSAKDNKASEAVALYDELAANSALDEDLRNLARVRAALLLSDTASMKDVEARIGELTKAINPWHHSAREILAITAFRTGDIARAEKLFNQLSADATTPAPMRTRATVMVSIIAPKLSTSSSKK